MPKLNEPSFADRVNQMRDSACVYSTHSALAAAVDEG
jgi:hypothetical protein